MPLKTTVGREFHLKVAGGLAGIVMFVCFGFVTAEAQPLIGHNDLPDVSGYVVEGRKWSDTDLI